MSKKCSFDIEKLRSHIKFGKTPKSKKWRYIPELNEWIQDGYVAKTLLSLGMTTKDWFDKHFLLKDEDGNSIIPVCETCGKPLKFYNLTRGYQMRYCCSKCNGIGQSLDEDFRKSHSDAAKKVWAREDSPYRTEEYIDALIKGFSKNYNKADKAYRNLESRAFKKNYSAISYKMFSEIEDILSKEYCIELSDLFYGSNEYNVYLSSEVIKYLDIRRSSKMYRMDFYIKSLNRCIEFNGDYWHSNISKVDRLSNEDEYSTQYIDEIDGMLNENNRLAAITIELGMKDCPLVIWEHEYKSNPSEVIKKCINYIARGPNFRDKSDIWDEIHHPSDSSDKFIYPFEFYFKNSVI